MFIVKKLLMVCLILIFSGNIFAADVILNEYNAVANSEFLNGGTAQVDDDGRRASDSYFGRVLGNGGDWFELVVITDHLDMREWQLDIYNNGGFIETLDLTDHSIWADLRSGTIITVSEDVPSDISYDPAAGDWWINVQANTDDGDGLYIEATNFAVHSSKWQLKIRDAGGATVFDLAGEGVSPESGISDTEIFRLEATPSGLITCDSPDYDDGKKSTFGAANQWGSQKLYQLRNVAPEPSSISLLEPDGSEIIVGGTAYEITWSNTGVINSVLIEFSIDNGYSWSEVYPPNIGNTGSYDWLVPIVDSEQCRIRLTNTGWLYAYDVTDEVFTIYECFLDGDLTGDCEINISDLAVVAASWLACGNPYDLECL